MSYSSQVAFLQWFQHSEIYTKIHVWFHYSVVSWQHLDDFDDLYNIYIYIFLCWFSCVVFCSGKNTKINEQLPTMRRGSRRKPWWTSFVRWRRWVLVVGLGGTRSPGGVGWMSLNATHSFFWGGDQTIHTYDYVVVSNIFHVHPYLGKWSNLTNIFQMCWHHQLDDDFEGFVLIHRINVWYIYYYLPRFGWFFWDQCRLVYRLHMDPMGCSSALFGLVI